MRVCGLVLRLLYAELAAPRQLNGRAFGSGAGVMEEASEPEAAGRKLASPPHSRLAECRYA